MTSEDLLKNYILTEYKSIRQFALENNLKYSTVTAILARGLKNSSIDNVMEICNALNISTESLVVNAEIVSVSKPKDNYMHRARNVEAYIKGMRRYSRAIEYRIDGIAMTEEEINDFCIGMEVLMELIRRKRRDKEA